MSTLYTIAVHVLAFVGLLSILGSVGVWLMTYRLTESDVTPTPVPASEVVARFTNHVRVVPSAQAVKGEAPGSGPVRRCADCGEPIPANAACICPITAARDAS